MKAGTTTLFNWLGNHPDCALPTLKEPAFFALQDRWNQGLGWYRSLFPEGGKLSGEASVIYTDPAFSREAAHRIAEMLPAVRLVFVARHPLERARSHYVHQVQRGRERKTFEDVARSPNNPYFLRSCYFSTLEPYIGLFTRTQMSIVWFEELFAEDGDFAWARLLHFLDLAPTVRPSGIYNRSDDRPILSGTGRWLDNRGFRTAPSWLPARVRLLARSLLTNNSSPVVRRLVSSAAADVGGLAVEPMWDDVHKFLAWAGSDRDRWR